MLVANNVIFSHTLNGREEEIRSKMRKKQKMLFLYCVTIPKNESNSMEIYRLSELYQKCYEGSETKIIAFASSKQDAMEIVKNIIHETCQLTQNYECDCESIKEYLRRFEFK